MFWFLKMLVPESCRANLFRVSLPRVVLSSAQITFAAPRWSTSTVKKSSRSRSPSQASPAVQTWPRWFGWSEICELLKSAPGFVALLECAKKTFHTEGFCLQPASESGSQSDGLPLESTAETFEFSPVSAW
jgi:hypothetical protein